MASAACLAVTLASLTPEELQGLSEDEQLQILKVSHALYPSQDRHFCAQAAEKGHLKIVQWVVENGYRFDRRASWAAAEHGHLHVLQWGMKPRHHSPEMYREPARNGHLHIVKWMKEQGYRWDGALLWGAAWGGHLDILKWVREQGYEWRQEVYAYIAAGQGHFEIVQWAHANGCPIGARTCLGAVESGNLEILKWLRAQGCSWHSEFLRCARIYKRAEMYEWALENGCPPEDENREKEYWEQEKNMVTGQSVAEGEESWTEYSTTADEGSEED